jgi:repressor LexA
MFSVAAAKPLLTERQQQALDFITTCLEERGYPPTLREIGEHMGIRSTNGVNDHLKALERKGYLAREVLKSRALRPIDETIAEIAAEEPVFDVERISIPILGRVAAGQPILAEENVIDRVSVDRFFVGRVPPSEVFGLQIQGDSMIEDGIFNGDFIFVRKATAARQGEIVVVMIDGEATCKRFYREGDTIRLQPGNRSMHPIFVSARDFRSVSVLGKVVGVYRRVS